VFNDTSNLKAN